MLTTFLLEIRIEELPVTYIEPALESLKTGFIDLAKRNLIEHGEVKTSATPRRLVLIVDSVSVLQAVKETKIIGPLKSIALGEDGNLTIAGEKFLEKNGLGREGIIWEDTPKGEKLSCMKTIGGGDIMPLLSIEIPNLIKSLSFPKTMRWDDTDITFARPIRGIACMLDDKVIPFKYGKIESSNLTKGHWTEDVFLKIPFAKGYVSLLHKHRVIVSTSKRKKIIQDALRDIEKERDALLIEDIDLLNDNTLMVEEPSVFVCEIPVEFINLPEEILITALREHQHNFCFKDKEGRLLPFTAVVSNNGYNPSIKASNEEVIFARLADASFFYEEDLRIKTEDRLKALEDIAFFPELGNMLDKTNRLEELSKRFGAGLFPLKEDLDCLVRAARLCKNDLASNLIGEKEFNSLQGKAGEYYALNSGEDKRVSTAIGEHYMPIGIKDNLPSTLHGGLLAFLDRIDTLTGLFMISTNISSSKDPFGLRRAALSLIRLWEGFSFPFTLDKLEEYSSFLYEGIVNKSASIDAGIHIKPDFSPRLGEMNIFIMERLRNYLLEKGYRYDLVNAVLGREPNMDIGRSFKIISFLNNLQKDDAELFKRLTRPGIRLANIIKAANLTEILPKTSINLFVEPLENELYDAFYSTNPQFTKYYESDDFTNLAWALANLDELIHTFFENVMVMDKNEKIKRNRLALIKMGHDMFNRFASFREILLDEE